MARRTTINDLGIDLLENIVSRLPALSFACADCVCCSWNHACHLVLCRPKLSSACSFNASLQVAVEDVVKKVLSEPIRPQFAIASICRLFSLEEALQLITAKLSSKVHIIVNQCIGSIGKDAISGELKESLWEDIGEEGVMLTVGFLPGLKVKPISLLKQIEDPQTLMIDQFITDIREFSTSISGCQSPAAIVIFSSSERGIDVAMEKLDLGMSSETVIVGDCGCSILQTTSDEDNEYVVAVALVFVMDRNKPPGTGETRFHAVLSNAFSPLGPTYKVNSVRVDHDEYTTTLTGLGEGPFETFERDKFRCIGLTKRRLHCMGQEDAKWMSFLAFHTLLEEDKDNEFLVVDGMSIKTGDTYQYYCEDSNISRSSNLLRSFKQRSTNGSDKWQVCGGLIFTSRYRYQPNGDIFAFVENFPGLTLGGTYCYKEIGRGYLTTQESQELKSARAIVHDGSTVYLIISYAP